LRIFAIPAHNATLAHYFESLLIAFALLNLFHKSIFGNRMYEDIANMMKSRVNIPNRLKVIVEKYNLSQVRSPYLEIHYTNKII